MKSISINNIVAEGFRSLSERTEVNVDRQGLVLVKGENGVGKTTLFEALVWCLYGINLKDTTVDKIPTWEETRTKSFRGTYVEVGLVVDGEQYFIIRTIAWSGGEGIGRDALTIKGVNTEGVHKKDIQAQVVSLLGVDAQTFMSSILFGQRMPKFVETDNKDKRDLFERLFETAFINDAKVKAAEKIKDLDGECIKFDAEVYNKTIEIEAINRDIVEQSRILGEFESNKKAKIEHEAQDVQNTEQEIKEYQDNIAETQEFIDAWDQDEYDRLKKEYNAINVAYNDIRAKSDGWVEKVARYRDEASKASRADVVAETNVKSQQRRDENWAMEKAEAVSSLKEELANLLNKQTNKLNNVALVCYACGQDLNKENIEAVKKSIREEFEPQLESVNTRLGDRQAEEAPESNLTELVKQKISTGEALDKASLALKKVEAEYEQFKKDNEDISLRYNQMLKDEETLDLGAMEVKAAIEDIKGWESDIRVAEERLLHQNEALQKTKDSSPPRFDFSVEDLQVQLGQLEAEKDEAQDQVNHINHEIDLHTWWSKKGFAASGLPAFVFKAMLDNLNKYVGDYAERLGVSIEFSIDLTKASKPFTAICSVGDKTNKEYKEFSGGQKQRLDIVLIFAMYDLVTAGVDINLLIMDEVFEGLDEAGEAAVFDLVRAKTDEGKAIYIITHSPHIDALYSSTIMVTTDENGATKIEG